MDKLTAFKILECEPTSNMREIKKAYAKKIREVHPEDDPFGFQKINEAYEYLKQPQHQSSDNIYTQQDNFEETIFIEKESTKNIDFDRILEDEQLKVDMFKQATSLIYQYLHDSTTAMSQYESFFQNLDYQNIVYSEEFIKVLIRNIKDVQMSQELCRFFYQIYRLNHPKTKIEKKLKQLLFIKNPSHLFNFLFISMSLLFIYLPIQNYRLLEIKPIIITLLFQFILLVIVYRKSSKKRSYQASILLVIITGIMSYAVCGTVMSMSSEKMMNNYVDITVPLLMVWFLIMIVLCVWINVKGVIKRIKSKKI